MDSQPTQDHLTNRQSPPPLELRNATRISFAILCSPTTYGVPLQKRMESDKKGDEYLYARNAAILRRECLRLDYLNPIIGQRIEHLRRLKDTVDSIQTSTPPIMIVQRYYRFLSYAMNQYFDSFWMKLAQCTTLSEFQRLPGLRIDTALRFDNNNLESHKQLSEYESLIKHIAIAVPTAPLIVQYLLLDQSQHSCLLHLTDVDRETKFYPLFTDRERHLLAYNLALLGCTNEPPSLQDTLQETIRLQWPGLITITSDRNDDYFRTTSRNRYDAFELIR